MDIQVETATVADAEDILDLQKKAFKSEAELYGDHTIAPLNENLEEMLNAFGEYSFLKAVKEGSTVGAVRVKVEEDTCYIGRLVVHPDFQNQGVGTILMNQAEERFPASRYFLFTGHKSEKNLYLYDKLGYHHTATEQLTDRIKMVFMEKSHRH